MTHTETFHLVKGNVHITKDEDNGLMDVEFEFEKYEDKDEEEEE